MHLNLIILILLGIAYAGAFAMTGAPVTPTQVGAPVFVWGTIPSGATLPVPTGATVVSFSITPVNAKAVLDIENGDGSVIDSVFLDDGFTFEAEVLYNAHLAYPVVGATASLVLPTVISGGAYLALSNYTAHSTYPVTIESTPVTLTRKGAGMVRITGSHRPGRDGAASGT